MTTKVQETISTIDWNIYFTDGRDSFFKIEMHCVKSVHIRIFSGPYFPAFELNTERYRVSRKKIQRDTEYLDQKNSEYGHFLSSDRFLSL